MKLVLFTLKPTGLTETLGGKMVGSGKELWFLLQRKGRHFIRPVEASSQMTFNHEGFSFTIGHIISFVSHALVPLLILAQSFL